MVRGKTKYLDPLLNVTISHAFELYVYLLECAILTLIIYNTSNTQENKLMWDCSSEHGNNEF